jgi:hypothetical protein
VKGWQNYVKTGNKSANMLVLKFLQKYRAVDTAVTRSTVCTLSSIKKWKFLSVNWPPNKLIAFEWNR